MIRQMVKIDEEKCNGCGLCADACHESAIAIIDGKARLIRDDYCDGLGNCLPVCPTGAISFEEREAAAYDEEAVKANQEKAAKEAAQKVPSGCPGSRPQNLTPHMCPGSMSRSLDHAPAQTAPVTGEIMSELTQWPVQIKLAPINAPYFDNANLLIAADCSAFTYGDFHRRFIRNHVTLIGCPKLDDVDYSEKLTEIIKHNNIKSVTIVRMEVPCCGGLENAAKTALQASGKFIPWQVVTISINGQILD